MGGGFIRAIGVKSTGDDDYVGEIPAVAQLGRLELDPGVTFLVGANGSGKSTLVEAIAVAAKLNAEGGGLWPATRFETRRSHSALELERGASKPLSAFFLRAESF